MTAHIHLHLVSFFLFFISFVHSFVHVRTSQESDLVSFFGLLSLSFCASNLWCWMKTWHISVIRIEWAYTLYAVRILTRARAMGQTNKKCQHHRKSKQQEQNRKKKNMTNSFEKLQSSVKWSAVCVAFGVCALQAVDPKLSQINVFSKFLAAFWDRPY